jgi:hypothetical protein
MTGCRRGRSRAGGAPAPVGIGIAGTNILSIAVPNAADQAVSSRHDPGEHRADRRQHRYVGVHRGRIASAAGDEVLPVAVDMESCLVD